MAKTSVLGIRLTDAEREHVTAQATMAGMTPTAWAKQRLLATPPTTAATVLAHASPIAPDSPLAAVAPSPAPQAIPPDDLAEARRRRTAAKQRPATTASSSSACPHPVSRRLGDRCALCGKVVAGKKR